MTPFKTVLAACGPVGGALILLAVLLSWIAPNAMNGSEFKKWLFIIGLSLLLIGVISIFVLTER